MRSSGEHPEQRQHEREAEPRQVHHRVRDADPFVAEREEREPADVRGREVPAPVRHRLRTSESHGTSATKPSGPRSSGKNAAHRSTPDATAGRNTRGITESFRRGFTAETQRHAETKTSESLEDTAHLLFFCSVLCGLCR